MSTLLAPPDPATIQPEPRDRPYGIFVDRAFGPDSTEPERRMYRWLYREFRKQPNSSPFSGRALVSVTLMSVDKIKDHAR